MLNYLKMLVFIVPAFMQGPWLLAGTVTFVNGNDNQFVTDYDGQQNCVLSLEFSDLAMPQSSELIVGKINSYENIVLLRYDLFSMICEFSTFNSVTLRLYCKEPPAYTLTCAVFRITEDNQQWQPGKSAWNYMLAEQPYQYWAGTPGLGTAGLDYEVTPLASWSASSSLQSEDYIDIPLNISLTPQLLDVMQTGLLIKTVDNSTDAAVTYYGAAATAAEMRPKLIIDYTRNIGFCKEIWELDMGFSADLNEDCVVNMKDLALLASDWMHQLSVE